MITFEVDDMTCGHCVRAINEALAFVDPGAKIQVDLASHRVHIEPTASTVAVLGDAIQTAGYTPVTIAGEPGRPTRAAPHRGCCCS
jgi:copper chaperone